MNKPYTRSLSFCRFTGDNSETLYWALYRGFLLGLTKWGNAVINIPATEPVQILIKGYDVSGDPDLDEIGLDDIRLVEYKCGKITLAIVLKAHSNEKLIFPKNKLDN